MTHARLPMHGRDHRPGGADPIPGLTLGGSGGSGCPSAMIWKQTNTDVAANNHQQIDFDASTFATTDDTVFSTGASGGYTVITILQTGLYVALLNVVNDNTVITDDTQITITWTAGAGGDELIVPRAFTSHHSGGTMFGPNGDGTSDRIIGLSWAYVADVSFSGASVAGFYWNNGGSTIHMSQRLLTVVQVQAITDLSGFQPYPS